MLPILSATDENLQRLSVLLPESRVRRRLGGVEQPGEGARDRDRRRVNLPERIALVEPFDDVLQRLCVCLDLTRFA